jgi:inosine triphosphate pyrophosphatase
MKVYFITGNKGKFERAKSIVPEIEQIDMDLPEIQELDSKKIIEEKLKEASKATGEMLICDDASLEIDSLGGMPGPLVKWFLKSIGAQGIYDLVKDKNKKARCRVTIGLKDRENILFFEEVIEGEIVSPRGRNGFGFDCLFKPNGHDKTLAEMSFEEKGEIGPRTKALMRLKEYLEKKSNS